MIISVMLTVSVCISVAAISTTAESSFIRGDADSDSELTITDTTVIQRMIADIPTPFIDRKAADVDGNGLNIMDATNIQRYLACLNDPYHIGEIVSDHTQPTQDEYELPVIPR